MKRDSTILYTNEQAFRQDNQLIAGFDEAGRGPIAGPVVVAAVILNPEKPVEGVYDSKQLSEKQRDILYSQIIKNALAYSIIEVSHQRIDEINILQAVLEGMKAAVESLSVIPRLCLIDGNRLPKGMNITSQACIKGDATYASIAAASILAKVHRDRIMIHHHEIYPEYGFARHKGYPTRQHLKALQLYGPCPIHRLTYGPVRQLEIWQR